MNITLSYVIGTHGLQDHCHPAMPGEMVRTIINTNLKAKSAENLLEPAGNNVEEILVENTGDEPGLPNPANLARRVNRVERTARQTNLQTWT